MKHVANAYDFVKNPEQNLIVMDLLGKYCLKEVAPLSHLVLIIFRIL